MAVTLQENVEIPSKSTAIEPTKITILPAFVLASSAAIIAEISTYPLDMLKTRMQITRHIKDPLVIAKTLFFNEGFSKIILGLDAACVRHIFYTGTRMMLYEHIRSLILKDKTNDEFPFYQSVICAVSAGAIGQFIASPTDFVKVQMQCEGLRELLGLERKYKNGMDCFISLHQRYGFIGLWNGAYPNVLRGAFMQIGGMTTYDWFKWNILMRFTNLKDDSVITHFISSTICGLSCTCIITPFDVIKTRMMNNPNEFNSTFSAFKNILKYEKIYGLYSGFFPIWARLGPWNMIFFMSFEHFRKIMGYTSF